MKQFFPGGSKVRVQNEQVLQTLFLMSIIFLQGLDQGGTEQLKKVSPLLWSQSMAWSCPDGGGGGEGGVKELIMDLFS